jgi:hypothetical protein
VSDEWSWTSFRGEYPFPVPLPPPLLDLPDALSLVPPTASPSTPSATPLSLTHTPQPLNTIIPSFETIPQNPTTNSAPTPADPDDFNFYTNPFPTGEGDPVPSVPEPQESVSAPNRDLLEAMVRLGLPFVDKALLPHTPIATVAAQNEVFLSVGGAATLGRRLLESAYSMLGVYVQRESDLTCTDAVSVPQSAVEPRPLLRFDTLPEASRTLILFEIQASSRAKPLRDLELTHLKALPLFTLHEALGSRMQTAPVATSTSTSFPASFPTSSTLFSTAFSSASTPCVSISACTSGVYWCDNKAVLDGVLSSMSGKYVRADLSHLNVQ